MKGESTLTPAAVFEVFFLKCLKLILLSLVWGQGSNLKERDLESLGMMML